MRLLLRIDAALVTCDQELDYVSSERIWLTILKRKSRLESIEPGMQPRQPSR